MTDASPSSWPSSGIMSDLILLAGPLVSGATEPYRVALRRLRGLRTALLHQVEALSPRTGFAYELDDRRLAAAFVAWLRQVEEQKPADSADRRAFFDFAAGLMLRELLAKRPLRAHRVAPGDDGPEQSWPEGFACTVFCINMLSAVLAQEYGDARHVAPEFLDARVWASFEENVREHSASAVGFLHLFVGREPDWITPTLFRPRLGAPAALSRRDVTLPG